MFPARGDSRAGIESWNRLTKSVRCTGGVANGFANRQPVGKLSCCHYLPAADALLMHTGSWVGAAHAVPLFVVLHQAL